MNSSGDDLFDLDFDPDVLIQLLGKLSLENIPSDVSDTLSSLENRTDENVCCGGAEVQNCVLNLSGENCFDISVSKEQGCDVLQGATAAPELKEESKSNFLSALGLVSDSAESLTKQKRTESLPPCKSSDKHNRSQCSLEFKENQNPSSCLSAGSSTAVIQKKSKTKSDFKATNFKDDDCDQSVPPWFAVDSVTKKSFSYYPLFREQGRVFDIQLGDINSIKSELDKLPFLTSDHYQKVDHSDAAFTQESDSNDSSYDSLILPKQNFESASKSPTSLDSGYETSSTVSPSPPLVNTKTPDSTEHFDETSDNELESIVATIVEVENSLRLLEASPSSANVPVLKDAKNEEDHKEKLLNFLKEPTSVDSVQVSVIVSSDENSSPVGTIEENFPRNIAKALNLNFTKTSPHSSRKSPLKAKDKILGYELKYASKNDHGHLVVFTKGKHFERNKILKQIQDDEGRSQKTIKFIQIIDKKIKRTATDERENNRKRRRLLSSKEENHLKDECLKCEQ